MDKHAIIIGAGLAGLVAARELVNKGVHVTLVDQENEQNLGGQAWWSFGGLFLVDSPEQRRLGIRDSFELARQDWFASAGFDRAEDEWGKKWAEAYVKFATEEKREWLRSLGISFFPVVGWAERGGYTAEGHGNSVPRFHIVWGTGPAILEPFIRRMKEAEEEGLLTYLPRHQVNELIVQNSEVVGIKGAILEPSETKRGEESSRKVVDTFTLYADAVLVSSGGIGANFELIRKNWPTRMGTPPENMIAGVPKYVDGRMLEISETAGANLVNRDRMWHYTEGIKNWDSVWPHHGIRILPGPSSMWLDATGKRLSSPNFPGFDTLGTLEALRKTGYDYSWFILTQKMVEKEFALSGSEQNPDLTGKSVKLVLKRILPGPTAPVQAFLDKGEDFVVADTIEELVEGMNRLAVDAKLDTAEIVRQVEARDREMDNKFTKDLQITALRGARNYIGDKLIRVAKPHKLLDPSSGPLIAVRLHIVSRKTLGGLQTDLTGRVLDVNGKVLEGLYAAGEVSGFGGGGVHGYRALEGTFLGGCLFSGRQAGRGIAEELT
ncbi:FAD-binding dehydrogenase [Paenisporosarcina cavernae]|uniref:FAD-binding dehydrogenase n=1 Tax=Paenisporosarcina cavernae TaxID=2320858 RepID=A0A385YSH1_9BACL|nr:FAD-binding dehydrogenase [Paenisporosarcina cavernae]AYC28602.1 FAD-binding dehydrogenase [Paenisporosarcina cavernae]